MRIQHNIMAMNAYRNYNINTSAVSKNLEKLSSGYRINRAGDDAAGLAISEKMRAQITGLDAATKNVKDGISLVKTAEGAMQEVQDMLNRMVNLATQSANGTYDNEIDRANLQAEVDQLRSEINRIADSANFNGIKLLDGSLEADTVKTKVDYIGKANVSILSSSGTDPLKAGTSTILHKDAAASSLSSFEVNLRDVSFTATTAATGGAITLSFGNGASVAVTGLKGTVKSDELAKKIADTIGDKGILINGVSYNVSVVDGDKLRFEMNGDSAASITDAASFNVPDQVTLTAKSAADGTVKGDLAQNGVLNAKQGSLSSGTVWASTYTDGNYFGDSTDFADGSGMIIGDTTYIFAQTDKTANGDYASNVKVVDLRDLVDPNTGVLYTDANTLQNARSRFTEAAKDNAMFDVSVDDDGKIGFYEKKTYNGDVKLDSLDAINSQIQKFDSMTTITETVKKGAGKALTLQIGDTSDSFNQLKVSIGDIHTQALGISQISVATQAGAAAAVNTIKNAINTVSSIRGTLGATQNRLEHTQNNLSVMKENIQDAESTIRDTDVAEEMMAYTKNNILVQSAQAMLAQANQIPQGVLQLLG